MRSCCKIEGYWKKKKRYEIKGILMIPNQIEAHGTYWAKIMRIDDKLNENDFIKPFSLLSWLLIQSSNLIIF